MGVCRPAWKAACCVETLEEAVQTGRPEICNRNQGWQFTSGEISGVWKKRGVLPSMGGRGRLVDNIFIERLWRTGK